MHLEYWHWIVLGFLLVIGELAMPTCTILWFGISAFLVGALLYVLPKTPLSWQLFVWMILSIAIIVLWFKIFKKILTDKTMAGMNLESVVGKTGLVVEPNTFSETTSHKGRIRFVVPLMGETDWDFISEDRLAVGDGARVVNFSGNSLIVVKK